MNNEIYHKDEISMSEKLRVCRKCLPRTETREEYFEKLSDYVKRMDEDLKVDQETYEKRLALCSECKNYLDGMCRLCGCFVELRAAQKIKKCPDIQVKWDRYTE